MTDKTSVPEREMYVIARFLGITGDQMSRLLGLLKLCEVNLAREPALSEEAIAAIADRLFTDYSHRQVCKTAIRAALALTIGDEAADAIEALMRERDEAATFIRILNEEFVLAGYPGGDRQVTLANVRKAIGQLAAARDEGLSDWKPIETVPRDGSWILASWSSSNLHAIHAVQWVNTPRSGWKKLSDGSVTEYDPALWLLHIPALMKRGVAG